MTTVAQIIAEAQRLEQDTDQATAAAKAKADKAEQAAEVAEQAAAKVAEAERQARANLSGQYMTVMRELTGAVRRARDAAATAIRDHGDAVGAWVAYRKLRATNRGKWQAIQVEYWRTTGHRPPPGDWGPPLRPDPEQNLAPETFEQFLHAVVVELERTVEQSEHDAAWDQVLAARAQGK